MSEAVKPFTKKEICPSCECQFESSANPYINELLGKNKALEAECERLRETIAAAQRVTSAVIDDRDTLAAELAAIRARHGEPDAWRNFDGEGGYDYTDDEETAERWKKSNGERYADWVEPMYLAQPPQPSTAALVDLLKRAYVYPLEHACATGSWPAQELCEEIDKALAEHWEGK